MKEYEITYNNKKQGKVKIFINNLNKNFKNSFISSNKNRKYDIVNYNTELQQYEIFYKINDIDELFEIVSKYKYKETDIFEEIDNIKKYNNLKTVKKDTLIKIIIPEIYLNNLNIRKNINKESLFKSKIYFIKNVLDNNYIEIVVSNLNNIINDYNLYKESSEYEFFTYEEKENKINNSLNSIDKLIKYIEDNTEYKYGKDFIIPIRINN